MTRSLGSMACSTTAKTPLLLQKAATNRAQAIKSDDVWAGGAKGIRTPDLLHAMQALYQLSYSPWTPAKRQQRLASVLDRHRSAVIAEHGLRQRARVVLQQPPPAAAPGQHRPRAIRERAD